MLPRAVLLIVLLAGGLPVAAGEGPAPEVDLAYAAARAADGQSAHAGERVRVAGVASVASDAFFDEPYKLYIEGEPGAVCLFSRRRLEPVRPGDRVEAEGRLQSFNGMPQVLLDRLAVTGRGNPPAPRAVALRDLQGPRLSGRLVEITATVIGRSTQTGGALNVTLAADDAVVVAHLTRKAREGLPPEDLDNGATVRVRGIASQYDTRPPYDGGWQIEPRAAADVRLLRPPPLFTRRELALGAGAAGALLLAGLAAMVVLQKEVRRRTRQYRETAERLELVNRQLREAMRLKDEVVSMVAHDFRAPLTLIQGYSEALQARVEDEEMRRQLGVIHGHARRLAALAGNTLTMSRLDAGALELDLQPVALGELARAAAEAQVGSRVEVGTPDGEVTVRADRQWLQEVMANLLGNAAKYSSGGRPIEVTVRRAAQGGEVAVANDGPPIPGEDMPRLFQKFSRLPDARTRNLPGTGLGLYICRSILEAHGGRIWAENEASKVVFRFVLPLEETAGS